MAKDVSVGEFDPATGLTHVTQQRGRLLFNMGASAKKRQRQRADAPAVAAKPAPPPTSIGAFTGLSLYPEEAHYLLQRGALAIFLAPAEGGEPQQLSAVGFTAALAQDPRVSLACVEVYAFLKDQKLHPRRCLEPPTAPTNEDGRSVPRHFKEGEACHVAFDVWKTVAVDVAQEAGTSKKQKQRKMLVLVFRVAVCRFGDPAPGPRSLRQAIERSDCGDASTSAGVPVKLAVVHHDQSVLLFEISSGTR